MAGYWISVGDQKVMTDVNGFFELDDFSEIESGYVWANNLEYSAQPDSVFDPGRLSVKGELPVKITVPFTIDPKYMDFSSPNWKSHSILAQQASGDAICGDGWNSNPCCRDYDGFLTLNNPAAWQKWPENDPRKLAAYIGSTCFKLVNRGWCIREGNGHWLFPNTPGLSCWFNHKYRNCQNLGEVFSLNLEKNKVLAQNQVRIVIENSTPANDTLIETTHAGLYGPRLIGFLGSYVLRHYDDGIKEHYASSALTFTAPRVPAGKSRIQVPFIARAFGRTLTATLNVVRVDKLEIQPSSPFLRKGETTRLTVRAFDDENEEIEVSPSMYHWSSSDPSVSKVSQDRWITGESVGKARITVVELESGIAASVEVQVTGIDHLETAPNPVYVTKGRAKPLTVKAKDIFGVIIPVPAIQYEWTSSAGSIVVVSSEGIVTGVELGESIITIMEPVSEKSTNVLVKVVPAQFEGTIQPERWGWNKEWVEIRLNEELITGDRAIEFPFGVPIPLTYTVSKDFDPNGSGFLGGKGSWQPPDLSRVSLCPWGTIYFNESAFCLKHVDFESKGFPPEMAHDLNQYEPDGDYCVGQNHGRWLKFSSSYSINFGRSISGNPGPWSWEPQSYTFWLIASPR